MCNDREQSQRGKMSKSENENENENEKFSANEEAMCNRQCTNACADQESEGITRRVVLRADGPQLNQVALR